MAKRKTYGNTWWGAAWLAAISNVPNENRLGRGRSYYQSGRVRQASFDTSTLRLTALVDGSAYYPYEVSFSFDPLKNDQKERLLAAVREDPELVAEILDGNLPPQLLDLCRSRKIELFPTRWQHLHPQCSCPDSSPFCKHIAALFYLLLDQIDGNPFLVFLTRGVDLKAEMKKAGVDITRVEKEKPRTPSEILSSLTAGRAPIAALSEEEALARLRRIDLSALPDMSEVLARLLPARFRPSTPEDQARIIKSMLRKASAFAHAVPLESVVRALQEKADEGKEQTSAALLELCEAAGFKQKLIAENARITPVFDCRHGIDPVIGLKLAYKRPRARKETLEVVPEKLQGALARTACSIPARILFDLAPETECFEALARAACALLAARAVTPVPMLREKAEEGACPRIWWMPMMREPRTARLIDDLARGAGPWLASLLTPASLEAALLEADDPRFAQKAVVWMLTALLSNFMAGANGDILKSSDSPAPQTVIAAALDVSSLDGRTPQVFAEAITRYFRAFLIADGYPWRPVLTARSHATGVKLNFGILAREVTGDALAAIEADETKDETEAAEAGQAQSSAGQHAPLDLRRPVMLRRLLTDEACSADCFAVLSVIKTLSEAYPILERIPASRGKPVTLTPGELKEFLFEAAPVLMVLGVTVMLPQSLKHLVTPRLAASVSAGKSKGGAILGKDALSRFDWQAALGDKKLTLEELEALAAHAGEVVRMGEDFVYIEGDALAKIIDAVKNQPQPTYLEKMRAALMGEYEGAQVTLSDELKEKLKGMTQVADVAPPAGLAAVLRPYQQRGFSWLMKNLRLGLGALIADDMGLGKTLQVIAALTALKEDGALSRSKVLVVVPTTLLTNWQRELAKFSPSLTVGLYHGPDRALPPKESAPDVTLTSYGTLRRDAEALAAYGWRLLVLDEAQAVKNSSTSQSVAVRALKAPQTIAMTGTPVENRLLEYWSIFEAVQPRLLGSIKDFTRTFAAPIESAHDAHAAEAFRRLTAPFMLRRVKTDKSIIADLPEKNSIDQFTTLTPEQAALYQKTLDAAMRKIEKVDEEASKEGLASSQARTKRLGTVLKLITSLKQICNSPSQYLKTETALPDSGKGQALLETLARCKDAERKVLIFTQYREMGERLQRWIANATGEAVDFLNGAVPLARRQSMVDRFQTDRSVRTLIVSLKAGGTGLNLTAASAVIHYDLWWNPAVEAQATDRAYRIGQRRDVLVLRFVTAGTFEERINEMLADKRELADLTVAAGETWIGELSSKELAELFALESPKGKRQAASTASPEGVESEANAQKAPRKTARRRARAAQELRA